MKVKRSDLLFVILISMAVCCWCQSTATRSTATAPQTSTITAEKRALIEKTVLSDPRVRQIIGTETPRVLVGEAHADKAEAEAFLAGATQKQPTHYVSVIIFNPKTNKAVHSLMSLEQQKLLQVQEINPADVPMTREDAEEALALAKASQEVRRAVGPQLERFILVEPGNTQRVPLAAQVLPLRTPDQNDPCSTDRCVDLIFRTEKGYLPVRPTVDLTKRTVTLSKSGHAEEEQ